MTEKEKAVLKMIDEVAEGTFGINPYQVKKLKEKFMKAPFPLEEIRAKVEEICKDISDKALDKMF